MTLSEMVQGEKPFRENVILIDISTHLPFLTFPKVRGEITHPPFLLKEYACVLSITVQLCPVPEFGEGGNLLMQVNAAIDLEEGEHIDIGE